MTLDPERSRFLPFLAVGAFAAAVNVVSRIAINQVTSYEVAIVIAFFIAMTIAFVLNKVMVFASRDSRVASEYLRFGLVNLVALVLVWCVSVGLSRLFPIIGFTWHPETVAHVIGVASPIYTSYIGHKYFSFGRARGGSQ